MFDGCEICGEAEEHDEHDAIVIREGGLGQFLSPTLILDVDDMFPGELPHEILDAAKRWLDQMGMPSDPYVTDDEYESVLDASTYEVDNILAKHGLVVVHDDGYVIFRL